jgi:glutamate synthase (NADPH/NADH)
VKEKGLPSYQLALPVDRVCCEATQAINDGMKVIILSDCTTGPQQVPLSALIACSGVHYHLVLQKKCAKIALIKTGEPHEVQHLYVLVGYGADVICPWLMMEAIHKVGQEGL